MDLIVSFAYAVGSVICHQLPERSFFIDGRQLPVCARCTGLYVSGAVGLLGWIAVKFGRSWRGIPVPPRTALAIVSGAAMPTAISYVTGVTGVWDGSNLTRAALAVPLGVAAGAVVAAVATKDLR
jgi:uncharacterized membrane protein